MKVRQIPHVIFETTKLSGWVKLHQISHVIFEAKGQFF